MIRLARERCGLSQSQAAEIVNCHKQYIWELESGRVRNPTIVTLVSLSNAYDIDLGELCRRAALCAPGLAHRQAVANWRLAKQRLANVEK